MNEDTGQKQEPPPATGGGGRGNGNTIRNMLIQVSLPPKKQSSEQKRPAPLSGSVPEPATKKARTEIHGGGEGPSGSVVRAKGDNGNVEKEASGSSEIEPQAPNATLASPTGGEPRGQTRKPTTPEQKSTERETQLIPSTVTNDVQAKKIAEREKKFAQAAACTIVRPVSGVKRSTEPKKDVAPPGAGTTLTSGNETPKDTSTTEEGSINKVENGEDSNESAGEATAPLPPPFTLNSTQISRYLCKKGFRYKPSMSFSRTIQDPNVGPPKADVLRWLVLRFKEQHTANETWCYFQERREFYRIPDGIFASRTFSRDKSECLMLIAFGEWDGTAPTAANVANYPAVSLQYGKNWWESRSWYNECLFEAFYREETSSWVSMDDIDLLCNSVHENAMYVPALKPEYRFLDVPLVFAIPTTPTMYLFGAEIAMQVPGTRLNKIQQHAWWEYLWIIVQRWVFNWQQEGRMYILKRSTIRSIDKAFSNLQLAMDGYPIEDVVDKMREAVNAPAQQRLKQHYEVPTGTLQDYPPSEYISNRGASTVDPVPLKIINLKEKVVLRQMNRAQCRQARALLQRVRPEDRERVPTLQDLANHWRITGVTTAEGLVRSLLDVVVPSAHGPTLTSTVNAHNSAKEAPKPIPTANANGGNVSASGTTTGNQSTPTANANEGNDTAHGGNTQNESVSGSARASGSKNNAGTTNQGGADTRAQKGRPGRANSSNVDPYANYSAWQQPAQLMPPPFEYNMPQGPAPAGILAGGGGGAGGTTRGVAFGRGWDSQGGRTDRKRVRFDNQPRFDNTPWRSGGWRSRGGRGRGISGRGRAEEDPRRFERWGWRNTEVRRVPGRGRGRGDRGRGRGRRAVPGYDARGAPVAPDGYGYDAGS